MQTIDKNDPDGHNFLEKKKSGNENAINSDTLSLKLYFMSFNKKWLVNKEKS